MTPSMFAYALALVLLIAIALGGLSSGPLALCITAVAIVIGLILQALGR